MSMIYNCKCVMCDNVVTTEEISNNGGVCFRCRNKSNEENDKYHDKEIVSNTLLVNQNYYEYLFAKYPSGILIQKNEENGFEYDGYKYGLLTNTKTKEQLAFRTDLWAENPLIPVVSVRITSEGKIKVVVIDYITKK